MVLCSGTVNPEGKGSESTESENPELLNIPYFAPPTPPHPTPMRNAVLCFSHTRLCSQILIISYQHLCVMVSVCIQWSVFTPPFQIPQATSPIKVIWRWRSVTGTVGKWSDALFSLSFTFDDGLLNCVTISDVTPGGCRISEEMTEAGDPRSVTCCISCGSRYKGSNPLLALANQGSCRVCIPSVFRLMCWSFVLLFDCWRAVNWTFCGGTLHRQSHFCWADTLLMPVFWMLLMHVFWMLLMHVFWALTISMYSECS